MYYTLKNADIRKTKIESGFWEERQTVVREKMVPFQWKALNDEIEDAAPSHCVENFRIAAGEQTGEFYGCVFQDSDLAKWIEEASYSLITHPDPELEALIDDAIGLIGRAQQSDGYLNTYYTVAEPENRYKNLREGHELYCAGHMMEAAVAWYQATGKRNLLDIMMRMAKNIDSVFGPEEGKLPGYPGHPEIELALMRMYEVTGEEFLAKLAKFFVDQRGQEPDYFDWEKKAFNAQKFHFMPTLLDRKYAQHHKPVREQDSIEGHSVRALYLLSGMIDVAVKYDDEVLMKASDRLFDSAVNRRMYITGGVGSSESGESFTLDYDLPNDTVYAETCASVALIFAANRMFRANPKGVYGDVIERALYNTCLAGSNLLGEKFFYVNPLEVDPEKSKLDFGKHHVLPTRPKWFGCACCPPNLARLLASLGQYIYASDDKGVYVNLYAESKTELDVGERTVIIAQETGYPYESNVRITLSDGDYILRLRIPEWTSCCKISLNGEDIRFEEKDGFAVLNRTWKNGDTVEIIFDMKPKRVYASANVSEDVGLVAVQSGPIVYCVEECDNGKQLHRLYLPKDAELVCSKITEGELAGNLSITAQGERIVDNDDRLYSNRPLKREAYSIHMVPYFTWANRTVGEMRVWLHEC